MNFKFFTAAFAILFALTSGAAPKTTRGGTLISGKMFTIEYILKGNEIDFLQIYDSKGVILKINEFKLTAIQKAPPRKDQALILTDNGTYQYGDINYAGTPSVKLHVDISADKKTETIIIPLTSPE